MMVNTLSFLASFLYGAAGTLQFLHLSRKLALSTRRLLGLSFLAVSLHGYVLYRWIDTPLGQNLSISHVFSLVCWLISCAILITSFKKPVQNLCAFILPLSALSILLALLFPGHDIFRTRQSPSSLLHILMSILAFGTLGIAALQASVVYFQDRFLRNKSTQGMIQVLPPLQTMETLSFQMLWCGFLLLSATIVGALLWLKPGLANLPFQKIVPSLLAWTLFAIVLYRHHGSGLRGLKALRLTIMGVLLLSGAYLAGKFTPQRDLIVKEITNIGYISTF